MKFSPAIRGLLFPKGKHQYNIRLLSQFFLVLAVMVIVYSIVFHFLMAVEDRHYSWITGFYWTVTVMTTLHPFYLHQIFLRSMD